MYACIREVDMGFYEFIEHCIYHGARLIAREKQKGINNSRELYEELTRFCYTNIPMFGVERYVERTLDREECVFYLMCDIIRELFEFFSLGSHAAEE